MWPTEKTQTLIELLHSKPALWDVTSRDYKNRLKKAEALKEVADKLSVHPSEADKKIKALKIQFRREHVKMNALKSSGNSLKRCAWFGYEPLLFLLQQGQERRGGRTAEAALCKENLSSVTQSSKADVYDSRDEKGDENSTKELKRTSQVPATLSASPGAAEPSQEGGWTSLQTVPICEKNKKSPKHRGAHEPPKKSLKVKHKRKMPSTSKKALSNLYETTDITNSYTEDQYSLFANHIASQLRELSLKSFLVLQEKIQSLVTHERLATIQATHPSPPPHSYSPSPSTSTLPPSPSPSTFQTFPCAYSDKDSLSSYSNMTNEMTTEQVVEEPKAHQGSGTGTKGPRDDGPPTTTPHPRRSSANKMADDKMDEALQVVKTFILEQAAAQRDEYHAFGEYVAHKLRNCGRSKRELSLAQHNINETIFNLEMGHLG